LRELSGSQLEPEYRKPRAGDVRDSLADISKIEKLLGYKPTVNVEQGLKLTMEWNKNNKDLVTGK
jgi:UDP-N-acetylglucosamine/UDP-N-acetylgalactosamine 4-epimerase